MATLAIGCSKSNLTVEEKVEKPPAAALAEIARDLAVYCQSVDRRVSGMGLDWLPDSARKLDMDAAEIAPGGAHLSKGRQQLPSYDLKLDDPEAGASESSWLMRFTADRKKYEEVRVSIPRDQKISRAEFITHAQRAYAERIAHPPSSDVHRQLHAHFSRVEFAFVFQDRAAARELLRDSTVRAPDLSSTRVALALFDKEGMEALEKWSKEAPTFRRLTDAALAHGMVRQVEAAIRFTREGLALSLKEEKGQVVNASGRVMPIAELALTAGEYDAAIDISRHMHDATDIDDYSRRRFEKEWRAIRAAATYRKGDRAGAAALVSDGLDEPDPFYKSMNEPQTALAKVIRAGDDAAVAAWKPGPGANVADDFFAGVKLLTYLDLDTR